MLKQHIGGKQKARQRKFICTAHFTKATQKKLNAASYSFRDEPAPPPRTQWCKYRGRDDKEQALRSTRTFVPHIRPRYAEGETGPLVDMHRQFTVEA